MVKNTGPYNEFVSKFIEDKNIKSVVDLGCGDWQSSWIIYDHLHHVDYVGIDCVESVINTNKMRHPRHKFISMDFISNAESIPSGDLCVIKDVLQHLTCQEIRDALDAVIKKFKYVMITNCCDQTVDNQEEPYRSRFLSANFLPLRAYSPVIHLKYWTKEVSVITT